MRTRLAHQPPNHVAAAVRSASRAVRLRLRRARERIAGHRAFIGVGGRHGGEERGLLHLRCGACCPFRVGRFGAHASAVGALVGRVVERCGAHGDLGVPATVRPLHAQVLVAVVVGGRTLPRFAAAAGGTR